MTGADVQRLAEALAQARGAAGYSADDLERVVQWAQEAETAYACLGLVRRGLAIVDVRDGQVCIGLAPPGIQNRLAS